MYINISTQYTTLWTTAVGNIWSVPNKIFVPNNKWDKCNFRYKICQTFNQIGANGAAVMALRHKAGGSWFDFRRLLGNFQATYSFGPHSVALEYTQLQNRNEYRPASKADNSAVLVVPNVKVRMEAQHSVLPFKVSWLVTEKLYFTQLMTLLTLYLTEIFSILRFYIF